MPALPEASVAQLLREPANVEPTELQPEQERALARLVEGVSVPPTVARCTACDGTEVLRLNVSWQVLVTQDRASIPIVGCGNPWHYTVQEEERIRHLQQQLEVVAQERDAAVLEAGEYRREVLDLEKRLEAGAESAAAHGAMWLGSGTVSLIRSGLGFVAHDHRDFDQEERDRATELSELLGERGEHHAWYLVPEGGWTMALYARGSAGAGPAHEQPAAAAGNLGSGPAPAATHSACPNCTRLLQQVAQATRYVHQLPAELAHEVASHADAISRRGTMGSERTVDPGDQQEPATAELEEGMPWPG